MESIASNSLSAEEVVDFLDKVEELRKTTKVPEIASILGYRNAQSLYNIINDPDSSRPSRAKYERLLAYYNAQKRLAKPTSFSAALRERRTRLIEERAEWEQLAEQAPLLFRPGIGEMIGKLDGALALLER